MCLGGSSNLQVNKCHLRRPVCWQHLTFLVNLEFHAGANDQLCRHLSNDFWVVLVHIIWRSESGDSESLAARWDAGASNEDAFFAVKVVLSICSSRSTWPTVSDSDELLKSDVCETRRDSESAMLKTKNICKFCMPLAHGIYAELTGTVTRTPVECFRLGCGSKLPVTSACRLTFPVLLVPPWLP